MLGETWEKFCLFSSRVPPGSTHHVFWAIVSTVPYLLLLHKSSVLLARREIHEFVGLAGMIFAAGCTTLLKSLWKQPRPSEFCKQLKTCGKFGMPSAHTVLVVFVFVWEFLVRAKRQRCLGSFAPITELVFGVLGVLSCTCVGVSRVVLGYHTVLQVGIGAVVGAGAALVCFFAFVAIEPMLLRLLQCKVAKYFRLKDTLTVSDPLLLEYEMFMKNAGLKQM